MKKDSKNFKKVLDKRKQGWYYNWVLASSEHTEPWKRYRKERSAINKTVIPKSELEDQETDLRDKGLNGRVWSWLRTNAGGVPNTCKSSGDMRELAPECFSGGRVSNAWATFLSVGNNTGKPVLIPHETTMSHDIGVKDLLLRGGLASD